MTTLNAAQARVQFGEIISHAQYAGERTVIRRNGKIAAVVISPEDHELLRLIENRLDLDEARRRLAEDNGKRVSWDSLKAELGL
jgi:PHD/YefM family antitoxin component YafN of YafNO toxin-antitoxin module